MTALLDSEDTLAMIREYAASRDWYIFIAARDGMPVLTDIETRHYHGAASADFALIILPLPGFPVVAAARKSRMTPAELAAILEMPVADMGTRDVIALARGPEDEAVALASLVVARAMDGL